MKIKKTCFTLLVLAAITSVFASMAMAENWPRFRGPNGQGISSEKGIPAKWSKDDIAWKVKLDGKGHSSPVIWDDKIFITFANDENTLCTLMAVKVSDGSVLWQNNYTLQPIEMNDLNSAAASTPAVDETGVYAIWYEANRTQVIATDLDGKEMWKKDFRQSKIGHGPGASLIIYKDIIVFTLEQRENDEGLPSFWYALDKKTGQIKWELKRMDCQQGSSSTPCLYPAPNRKKWLIFSSRCHGITAVDPDNGTVVWEDSALPRRVVSSPVVAKDLIVHTCGRGGSGVQLNAVRPPAGDSSKAEIIYKIRERIVPNVPTPILSDKWLFLFHDQGTVSCLDNQTGKVLWSEKPGGKFFGSPVIVEDRLYCINMKGQVVVLKASDKYERLAVNDLGEPSHATPAISNGRMILRTFSHLYCIEAEKN